jgi:hypothetical protein
MLPSINLIKNNYRHSRTLFFCHHWLTEAEFMFPSLQEQSQHTGGNILMQSKNQLAGLSLSEPFYPTAQRVSILETQR